jgi:inner membrane protein
MDLISHGLAGALVAQAGFAQRIGRPAVIALVAGAVLPDIDVVMAWVDELSVIRYHRGLTHSFMGALLLAVPLAALLSRFGKCKRFWPLMGLGALGVLTHIALDLPTSFGTMIFTPFSQERYALNWIFIIDPMYSSIILLALAVAYRKPQWARTAAVVGMGGLVLYLGMAAAMHEAARARFTRAVEADGVTALRVEAYPMRLDHYLKPKQDGLFTTAAELEEVQAFLEFARFPWMTVRQDAEHTVLEYYDLRFGAAPHHNDFRLEVVLDTAGVVRRTHLNHRF